jgi:hypothetical protein
MSRCFAERSNASNFLGCGQASVIDRMEATPWEGAERTKTILSFKTCGGVAAAFRGQTAGGLPPIGPGDG